MHYICSMNMIPQLMKQPAYLVFCLFITVLSSCNTETGAEVDTDTPPKKLTFEERVFNHVSGHLSIPSTEKFTYKVYKAQMNSDNFEDAIITVNRLEYAKTQAPKMEIGEEIAKMGYFGNYNYFFFYDGSVDKFSVPITLASSAVAPLKVKFENIITDSYSDLTIEYRVDNSAYKAYYTLTAGTLQKVFEIKMYDFIGTENPEVYYFEYGKGSMSYAKDILVYEGKIKDYTPNIKDIYTYEPVIEKKDKLVYRWFYNPQIYKYMTPDPAKVKK